MRKKVRKPFSEMSTIEKRREAEDAIARLSHPHNRYSPNCQEAIMRWRETIRKLDGEKI